MENKFPLRLESYFYIDTDVSPNPSFEKDKEEDCKNKVSVLIRKENDKLYCVAVTVELDHVLCKNYAYRYKVQNFGVFVISEQLPDQTARQLIKETGVPILIGAIRERLVSLTSNGPFPPVFLELILPGSINFND